MTQDEFNKGLVDGTIKQDAPSTEASSGAPATEAAQPAAASAPASEISIDQFVPILMALQGTQQALSAPPTFIPQTFQDQIQFVFDGTSYSIYVYFANQWNLITAIGGGVNKIIAGPGVTLSPSSGVGNVTISSNGSVGLAIARDAASNGFLSGSTTLTVSHTCTGSHGLLVVGLFGKSVTTDLVTGVTYNGIPMTRINAEINFGGDSIWMYALLGPSTGANNIIVSCSSNPGAGGGGLYMAGASYTGVLQTGFPENGTQNQTLSGTSQITNLSTANNYEWLIAVMGGAGTLSAPNTFANGTQCLIVDSNGSVNPPGTFGVSLSSSGGVLITILTSVDHG